jgi:hypothetical protein
MLSLTAHSQGVVLPVKAQPGAKRSGLCGVQNGVLKVAVTQIAEKGKANQALVEILADSLGLRKSQLRLLAGETARNKRFLVIGIDREELTRRIDAALKQTG